MKIQIIILSFILIAFCSGCSQKEATTQTFDEDYVLVEFASKLEEDFHKLNNLPTDFDEIKKNNGIKQINHP